MDSMAIREEYIDKQVKKLKRDNEFLTERIKVLEKRLDFQQDISVKLAVEQDALVKSVKFIVDVAHKLMDKKENQNNDNQSGIG